MKTFDESCAHSTDEALQRWRAAVAAVRSRKRFRYTANLDKSKQRKNALEKIRLAARMFTAAENPAKDFKELLNKQDEVLEIMQIVAAMKPFRKLFLDHDGSIQSIDLEQGFGSTSRQEVIPVCLHSGPDHFQNATFAITPDIGGAHLSTSVSRAPNSVAAQETASDGHLNRRETSNGADTRIDMSDENDNQGGKTRMADVSSLATDSTVASSSGWSEFTCDGCSHVPTMAHRMHAGMHLNRQETSNRADTRIDMSDENDHQGGKTRMTDVSSLATDSTVASSSGWSEFTCDGCSHVPTMAHRMHAGVHLNRQETSNRAGTRIDMSDENNHQGGKTRMADVSSLATVSTVASSSGWSEFTCDGCSHVPTMAHRMHAGVHLNRQETSNRADTRIDMSDENDHQGGKTRMADVSSLATDSTVASSSDWSEFTCDGCSHVPTMAHRMHAGVHLNSQETSNRADTRIGMSDENDHQGRKTRMADVSSLATDSTVASSSGCSKHTCDGCSHVPTMAHRLYAGAHLNGQETSEEAGATPASFVMPKDDDHPAMPNDCPHDHQALPVKANDCADETKILTKHNITILGITAAAAFALVSPSSSDSPFLRFVAAATGIGFLGSFFALYGLKRPKIARILSKIGAIGAASAVIIALGLYFSGIVFSKRHKMESEYSGHCSSMPHLCCHGGKILNACCSKLNSNGAVGSNC